MKIRKYKPGDSDKICKMVCDSFKKFAANEFSKKGIDKFIEEMKPKKQEERAKKRNVFIAEIEGQIAGMIEGTCPEHINRLFVDAKFHGNGIGKKLMKKIEKIYINNGTIRIAVNSSIFAIGFYEKMGYKKTRGIVKNKLGFIYQPMAKKFNL